MKPDTDALQATAPPRSSPAKRHVERPANVSLLAVSVALGPHRLLLCIEGGAHGIPRSTRSANRRAPGPRRPRRSAGRVTGEVEDGLHLGPPLALGARGQRLLHGVGDLPPALGVGVGGHRRHVRGVVVADVGGAGEEEAVVEVDGVVADVAAGDLGEHGRPDVGVDAAVLGLGLWAQAHDGRVDLGWHRPDRRPRARSKAYGVDLLSEPLTITDVPRRVSVSHDEVDLAASPQRVLVVANRTAATPDLVDAVRRHANRQPTTFVVLIPDAPRAEHPDWTLELALSLLGRAARGRVT